MNKSEQVRKAERFLALHHDPKLLVLPNIWDPLGARLLQGLGYPAVATASAAVAFSMGYDDGQIMTFEAMLDVISRVAASVDLPVTADVERGYADDPGGVEANMGRVIRAGAVGVNIEDSTVEGGPLFSVESQCARLQAARRAADKEEVPLVINARIDTFLGGVPGSSSDKVNETIARAKAYLDAGADCIYPITVGDIETLKRIRDETDAPINVYATALAAPMRELEEAGISRLSIGPWLIKSSLTAMKRVAEELRDYGSYDVFTKDAMSSDDVRQYLSNEEGN
jgi:2-methylisocitrate lyase-like PEP mutase family enzyme